MEKGFESAHDACPVHGPVIGFKTAEKDRTKQTK